MPLLAGVEYIIPIVIKKDYVALNNQSFIYRIDLTSRWNEFSKYINTSNRYCVTVYDPITDTMIPRMIASHLFSVNELVIHFNGAISKDQDKVFYICFGKTVNVGWQGPEVFSGLGYSHYWALDESGSNTAYSFIGGNDGNATANVTLGNQGFFGRSARNTGSGSGAITMGSEIISTGNRTIEFIYKLNSIATPRIISNGQFGMFFSSTNNTINLSSNNGTNAISANNAVVLNSWQHVIVTRTNTGVTNIYVNGQLSGTSNQSSGTPVAGSSNLVLLNRVELDRPFDGYLDFIGFTSNIFGQQYITTSYNQFAQSDFYTIGNGFLLSSALSNAINNGISIGF